MDSNTRGEVVDEASKWLVGGGILTMALAPLALPAIVLLLVAVIPLLALAIPFLLVAGLGIGAFRLARGVVRLAGRVRRPNSRTEGELVRIPAPHGS